MGAAAGAQVGPAGIDQPHRAFQRFFAAVRQGGQFLRPGVPGPHRAVGPHGGVGLAFGFGKLGGRKRQIHVHPHGRAADVKPDVLRPEQPVQRAGQNVLAGVLLAGVAPAGGIYRAFHPRAGGQRRIQAMPDHAVRNLHILHRRAAQKAGLGRLAAALGVEGGFIQRGPPTLAGRLTGQHGGRKGQRRGIGFVQFHGRLHQGASLPEK